ncbi:hypothetical protein GCM10027277_17140 [Pseudoduganella ginsengisoli]|uniref:Secretion system X translation initiation factor n=1 Tax=Pseudoduganella ginsengisoli TaxID=1462440 RepID=A0A6L6PV86_9BURK|nr:hypothetical protein [Pseudoduganella ginsengisoli]MTW01024.1 hypothetical protein [Pseudoduganella ginsengisoli]
MRKWIIAAGAATVALAWFAPDDDVVPAAAATPRVAPPAETVLPVAVQAPSIPAELQIQRRIEGEDGGNLFGGSAEAQPAQPAPLKPAAARAEAQQAAPAQAVAGEPALPFTFLGSYREGGQTTYLLQADGQDIVARVGDTIAGSYRLDAAQDSALSFTYLPRNQSMTLALTHATGEAN